MHGLTGHRENTWKHGSGFFLPAELAKDVPNARIMTFGYDANVVNMWHTAGSNNLRAHGKDLAQGLSDLRRQCKSRPIMFIAHSLGGLVCEQAILICKDGETNLEKVFESTRGVIFMGTPHAGADLAGVVSAIAKYVNVLRPTNKAILGVLHRNSEVLSGVQEQFQQMAFKRSAELKIFCFFESNVVPGVGKIVSEDSAVLKQYPNQSIAANHMDMTKFSGKNDDGYQKILNRVQDVEDSITELST